MINFFKKDKEKSLAELTLEELKGMGSGKLYKLALKNNPLSMKDAIKTDFSTLGDYGNSDSFRMTFIAKYLKK